jgi:hypothetical protein
MKAILQRYLNEVVGLTVLTLMVVALVAGQANRMTYDGVERFEPIREILATRLERRE